MPGVSLVRVCVPQVEIHDGPYNIIKNWDYCAMVEALSNKQGDALWTTRVCVEGG